MENIMKNFSVAILAISFVMAGPASAKEGIYIGVDTNFGAKTDLENLAEKSNDIGFNVFAGYSMKLNDFFSLGFDVEYRKMGEVDIADIAKVDADAYYLNVRPIFTDFNQENKLYSAFVLGVGQLNGQVSIGNGSVSETELSLQAGVEVGYMFDNGLDIGVGYRYASTDFDGLNMNVSGFTAGIRYHF